MNDPHAPLNMTGSSSETHVVQRPRVPSGSAPQGRQTNTGMVIVALSGCISHVPELQSLCVQQNSRHVPSTQVSPCWQVGPLSPSQA